MEQITDTLTRCFSSQKPDNNWQTARGTAKSTTASFVELPAHIPKFLAYLESSQFSHPSDFDKLDELQIEHYGRLITPLRADQVRTLCYELFKRHTWMPDGREVSECINTLFGDAKPGHVRESQRPIRQVLSGYTLTTLEIPARQPGDSGYERFLRVQWELKNRGENINFAAYIDNHLHIGVTEREVIRKRILRDADRKKRNAIDLFNEEYRTGENQP